MFLKKTIILKLLMFLSFCIFCSTFIIAEEETKIAEEETKEIISNSISKIFKILNDNKLKENKENTIKVRKDQFWETIEPIIDFEYISKVVISTEWMRIKNNKAKKSEFLDLFTKYLKYFFTSLIDDTVRKKNNELNLNIKKALKGITSSKGVKKNKFIVTLKFEKNKEIEKWKFKLYKHNNSWRVQNYEIYKNDTRFASVIADLYAEFDGKEYEEIIEFLRKNYLKTKF
ncbi:MAG: ABC transporter substrate-binding protein [Arcobacter sp.]|nr:ABC transporter substrate-binding protein [Arcobacter sp.]